MYIITEDSNSARDFWQCVAQTFRSVDSFLLVSFPIGSDGQTASGNTTLKAQVLSIFPKLQAGDKVFVAVDCVANNTKGEVVELTEKQIKDALKGITTDEVYGLELSEAGELVMDKKNFFTTNMMKKIHTNTLIPMVEEDCLANLFYIVIGTHKEKGNTMYDVISSRYERTSFTEEKVKTLLDMHIISAGAKLENGAVVVASLEKPTAPVADGKQKEDKEKSDTL